MCELGKKWPDRQRSFRLPHENAGSDVERLCAAGRHQSRHHSRRLLNDELHDAIVIKQRKNRGDKDNSGKHLKREEKSHWRALLAEIAENKLRTKKRIVQYPIHRRARFLK